MKTLNLLPRQTWDTLYPMFAEPFLLSNDYEVFAQLIQKQFTLTPEQWGYILKQWEFKESILKP